eukprot:6211144-Pleurochrysis_carterae.AAC.2
MQYGQCTWNFHKTCTLFYWERCGDPSDIAQIHGRLSAGRCTAEVRAAGSAPGRTRLLQRLGRFVPASPARQPKIARSEVQNLRCAAPLAWMTNPRRVMRWARGLTWH